jgi:hypothetical protein
MKLDFKEISTAWFNKLIHTKELKELADKRLDICLACPFAKEILEGKQWSLKCSECGCPLSGKIYTPKTYMNDGGSCPHNKWKDVEEEYRKNFKNTKTVI